MTKDDIKILKRKLEKARDNDRLKEISEYSCSLAACLTENEEYEEALNLYRESLNASECLDHKEGIILAHRMIAETCMSLGYFDEALKHVNIFLKYAQNGNNKVEEQRGYVLKGHVFFTQAEYLMDAKPEEKDNVEKLLEQSMDAYRKSFVICVSQLPDISEKERLQMKARLLQNKSLVLIRQNKLDHAQNHLIRAVKICVKEKLKDTECMCYLSLGDLYVRKEEYANAVNVFDKAFELSNTTARKIDSLLAKARAYIQLEKFDNAKSVLRKAYKMKSNDETKKLLKQICSISKIEENLCLKSSSDLKERRDLYKKLGNIYCTLKIYKRGIKSYLNMLGCCQKINENHNDLVLCYKLLCDAFTNDRQYDKALFYCNQEVEALVKHSPGKVCKTYLKIAKLHELNCSDFEEIYFAYNKAKTKSEEFDNHKLKVICLKSIIRIGNKFNKSDLVEKSKKELLNSRKTDGNSSCESESDTDSEMSESDEGGGQSSSTDSDVRELLQETDIELEEFDRTKERCKRSKFSIRRNEMGETNLHVAAIKGNYRKVKGLIDQGHPVNVRDTAGWTPLHEACNHGYVDIVNVLLDFGADINDKGGPCCDGITPLHDAATNGQLEVIELLIKRGASVLVLNNFGQTPLQCLLEWRKNSALDEDEEVVFKNIVKALKSPLDPGGTVKQTLKDLPVKNTKSVLSRNLSNSTAYISQTVTKPSADLSKPVGKCKSSKIDRLVDLSRRKRQAKGWSDDDDDSGHSDDSTRSTGSSNGSACMMYRTAMKRLRHKPKKFKKLESDKENEKRALIDARNYVENCIMDNDGEDEEDVQTVHHRKKGKKDFFEDDVERTSPVRSRNQVVCDSESSKIDFVELEDDCLDRLMKDIEASPPTVSPSSPPKPRPSDESKPTVRSTPWLNAIPSSLLEDGPQTDQGGSDRTDVAVDLSPTPEIVPTQSEVESSPILIEDPATQPLVDVTVQLLNAESIVSVNRSDIDKLTIDWLVAEVAKTNPILVNPDYCVTVKTATRSRLADSEPLRAVSGEKIELIPVKWKLLSLSDRYERVCERRHHSGFKHAARPDVSEALRRSSSTRNFSLSNLKLSPLTLAPICKAVKYESFVQRLDLSNNFFGDKGLESIVSIFDSCIIEELNVSGCNVTSSGLYHFSDYLNGMNEMSRHGLQVLDLSRNPITDDSTDAVYNIVDKLPNLTILNLTGCELETQIRVDNSPNLTIVQNDPGAAPS